MSNEYFGTDDFSFAEFVQKMEMVRWRWKTGKAVSCIYLLTVPPEAPKKAPPSNFNNEQSNNIVSQEMASKKTQMMHVRSIMRLQTISDSRKLQNFFVCICALIQMDGFEVVAYVFFCTFFCLTCSNSAIFKNHYIRQCVVRRWRV